MSGGMVLGGLAMLVVGWPIVRRQVGVAGRAGSPQAARSARNSGVLMLAVVCVALVVLSKAAGQ